MLLKRLVSFMLFQVSVISDVSWCYIVNKQTTKIAFRDGVTKVNVPMKEEFKVKNV
jgi:hypothetical protein